MSTDKPADTPTLSDEDFVRLLSELGAARLADERLGGPHWAEFQDWCFNVQEPTSPWALDVWLAERLGEKLSPKQVARLKIMAEPA